MGANRKRIFSTKHNKSCVILTIAGANDITPKKLPPPSSDFLRESEHYKNQNIFGVLDMTLDWFDFGLICLWIGLSLD